MKAKTLVDKAVDVAQHYKTLYVMGCFGAPLTGGNVSRYCSNHDYNMQADRTAMIKAAANKTPPVYGFDCCNLIKGILWGWEGNSFKIYGGAAYASNGVPDHGADTMIKDCAGVTTDFSSITVGEAVWCSGHIGIYIGNNLAVECTPRWKNCVQITAVANMGGKSGYDARTWTKHGKMPWVDYAGAQVDGNGGATTTPPAAEKPATGLSVGDVVTFTGTRHYVSSNSTNGKTCKPGQAKVTALANTGKHPYHLIKTTGSSSTVYGWVDAADVKEVVPAIVKGSKVKVTKGAKTYNGGSLASYVYTTTYTVIQIDGSRVVIGINGVVTAAVNIKDLTLVG